MSPPASIFFAHSWASKNGARRLRSNDVSQFSRESESTFPLGMKAAEFTRTFRDWKVESRELISDGWVRSAWIKVTVLERDSISALV